MALRLLLIVSVLSSLCLTAADNLKVLVPPNGKRCIGQELDPEDLAVFVIHAIAPKGAAAVVPDSKVDGGNVHVLISDPAGEAILKDKVRLGEDREITKDIKVQGVHQMCFKHNAREPIYVAFAIKYKNRAMSKDAKDAVKSVNDKKIPAIERQLASAQVLLEDISKEIDYAQTQEDALKEVTDMTNSRITWFSYLSMFVLLSSAVWQLLFLRNFFNSKKML